MKVLTKTETKKLIDFEVPMNSNLVHQIVTSQSSRRRQVIAHTKDRSEVSGGGRKPWRQKGTGKARHGSIRSPIWIGGGVTFGPTNEKNFKKDIPKKMRRKALLMVLTEKAKHGNLIIVDSIEQKDIKTKDFNKSLNSLKLEKKSCLIALPEMNENVIKSVKNIPKIETIQATDLNCLDLLTYKYLITTQEGLNKIKETFIKK